MPTGYTAGVQDGTIVEFKDFALQCARAFGACVMQRDEPMNVPPKLEEYSDYYPKRIKSLREEIAVLENMTDEEKELAAVKYNKDSEKSYRDAVAKNIETRNRYIAMRDKVILWTPPTTEHAGLKKFMLEQIDESIKFDNYVPSMPIVQTAEEYHDSCLEVAYKSMTWQREEMKKDKERIDGRNKWITDLHDSLKGAK